MKRISNPRPIPVNMAKEIGWKYGYDQVIIVARAVTDEAAGLEGGEHLTTWGCDQANCDVAARAGDFLKHKVMGWAQEDTVIHEDHRKK